MPPLPAHHALIVLETPDVRHLILISGPPAAGKSTVAQLIADALEPSVHLHGDLFFEGIRRGFVPPWAAGSRRQNEVVVAAMTAAALRYVQGGYHVVVDFVLGPWHLRPVIEQASVADAVLQYVVLRPSVDAAIERSRARGPAKLPDDAIRDLCVQFSDLDQYERHAVDSTTLTAAETAASVLAGISDGRWTVSA